MSIQFTGLENHGLDVNAVDQINIPVNSQHSEESQWELYKVTQKGGTSEWLIDVTRSGLISNAQAMICTPDQDEMVAGLPLVEMPKPNLELQSMRPIAASLPHFLAQSSSSISPTAHPPPDRPAGVGMHGTGFPVSDRMGFWL